MPSNYKNKIIQGDALGVLKTMESESIDCIVTSPPYWGLRDYGVDGQLGLEPDFNVFINNLCDVFDEAKRVLKKTGTCWVNLGDTYANEGQGGHRGAGSTLNGNLPPANAAPTKRGKQPLPRKCLAQIPARFALEMCDRGWILRNEIIWHKPNCMPASVNDRFTVDFEKIFFFVKSQTYWFEPQREPHKLESILRQRRAVNFSHKNVNGAPGQPPHGLARPRPNVKGLRTGQEALDDGTALHPGGRNKRCVWTISTKPYAEAHFAVYPPDLIETPIRSGCPQQICKKCGKAREAIYKPSEEYQKHLGKAVHDHKDNLKVGMRIKTKANAEYDLTGYTDCGCKAGWKKGIVLDPFMGAGTTAYTARYLGRDFAGIELNPEYIKLAEKRLAQGVLDI